MDKFKGWGEEGGGDVIQNEVFSEFRFPETGIAA